MRKEMILITWLFAVVLTEKTAAFGQAPQDAAMDRQYIQYANIPQGFPDQVARKTAGMEESLAAGSSKWLRRLSRQENRLLQKLQRKDTSAATRLALQRFADGARYNQFLHALQKPATSAPASDGRASYNAYLDTIKTSLSFLKNGPYSFPDALLNKSLEQVQQLENRLAQSARIDQYLKDRRQELGGLLQQYTHLPPGIAHAFNDYKVTGYYYKQQVQAWKETLKNPEKIERQTLALLRKVPAFEQFMQQHSELSRLFPLPAGYGTNAAIAGLPSREQVQQLLQQQVSAGGQTGQQFIQDQVGQGQAMLDRIRQNVRKYGTSGADPDMPDFKPNNQKTKTFLQRLEYGANIQLARASSYFPATGSWGLSVGYKLNDRSTVGIGGGYMMGMGTGWGHIRLSSQGLGLRTFFNWKIKGSIYAAGGYERNYLAQSGNITAMLGIKTWQESALMGLEKKYNLNGRLKGNMQLLFDAFYSRQLPRGQPVKFRIGYNF